MVKIHLTGGLIVSADMDREALETLLSKAHDKKLERITLNGGGKNMTFFIAHIILIEGA